MPIQFSCTSCNKSLRVADTNAGKQAKCPQCGTVLMIPNAAAAPAAAPIPQYVPPPAPMAAPMPMAAPGYAPYGAYGPLGNPYQPPLVTRTTRSLSDIQPGELRVGPVWNRTWELFRDNVGTLVLGNVLVVLVILGLYAGIITMMYLSFGGIPMNGVAGPGAQAGGPALGIFAAIMFFFGLFCLWLQGGLLRFYLKCAQHGKTRLSELFCGAEHMIGLFLSSVLATLLLSGLLLGSGAAVSATYRALLDESPEGAAAAGIGAALFALCINVWVTLGVSQVALITVDQRVGPLQSIGLSFRLLRGNRLRMFLILIVSMLVYFAGALAFGVGILFSLPFMMLMLSVTYVALVDPATVAQPERM